MGEGLIVICAVSYGISSITLKKISHLESPMTITAYQLLLGSSLLIAAGWLLSGEVHGFTTKSLSCSCTWHCYQQELSAFGLSC